MNKDSLMKQLMELDFTALDLALYLNTHPNDYEAISKYNEVISYANKIRGVYEQKFGPLCSFRSASSDKWLWINEPWPWQAQYNMPLCREERY